MFAKMPALQEGLIASVGQELATELKFTVQVLKAVRTQLSVLEFVNLFV